MNLKTKTSSRVAAPKSAARMVEVIFGCKWSLTVYQLINSGTTRPGQMVRAVDGLSTKVLNDCLKRNIRFGILERRSFDEAPPRVEYHFSEFGLKFVRVLKDLEDLQAEISEDTDTVLAEFDR